MIALAENNTKDPPPGLQVNMRGCGVHKHWCHEPLPVTELES